MSESDSAAPASHDQSPIGLGGPLWLFSVPLMLWGTVMLTQLPLIAWQHMSAQQAASKAALMDAGLSMTEYRQLVAEESLMSVVWLFGLYVAEAFFRRLSHFRWAATLWLVAASIVAWLSYSRGSLASMADYPSSHLIRDVLRILPLLLPIPYLWLSRRAHNTFTMSSPPRPNGWRHAFLDGPRDWGGGVWCIVGLIMLLVFTHGVSAISHWPNIFTPVPSVEAGKMLADTSLARGNTFSDVALAVHESLVSQVPYARWSLAQHVPGLLLALWSFYLFACRSSISRWALLGSALLTVSAEVTGLVMRDGMSFACFMCLDGSRPGDGLDKATAFFIVAMALLLLPAVRRRSGGSTPP